MTKSFAKFWLVLPALTLALGGPIAHSETELVPMPAPTPRQMGMTGAFVVRASDGLIQYKLHRGHWSRAMVHVSGAALLQRVAEARANGEQVIDLASFDLISAYRRVDSLRLLDGTSWSALAMIVALGLDGALSRGEYRYLLVSDDTHHVLLERSPGERIRMHTYVRIPGESQASFLQHRKLAHRPGYSLVVPELTKTRSGADFLLERLENIGVARSALLETLVASRV